MLYNLSKDPSVSLILETGTLDGTGATKCIVDGIQESGSGRLITIEAMKDSYESVSDALLLSHLNPLPPKYRPC